MKDKMVVIPMVIVVLLGLFFGLRYVGDKQSVDLAPLTSVTEDSSSGLVNSNPNTESVSVPVTLTIASPKNGSTVTTSSIAVKGKTVPKGEVFVNESETRADASGNFSVNMVLDEGDNYIIVTANDENGNVAEVELTVTYNP